MFRPTGYVVLHVVPLPSPDCARARALSSLPCLLPPPHAHTHSFTILAIRYSRRFLGPNGPACAPRHKTGRKTEPCSAQHGAAAPTKYPIPRYKCVLLARHYYYRYYYDYYPPATTSWCAHTHSLIILWRPVPSSPLSWRSAASAPVSPRSLFSLCFLPAALTLPRSCFRPRPHSHHLLVSSLALGPHSHWHLSLVSPPQPYPRAPFLVFCPSPLPPTSRPSSTSHRIASARACAQAPHHPIFPRIPEQ